MASVPSPSGPVMEGAGTMTRDDCPRKLAAPMPSSIDAVTTRTLATVAFTLLWLLICAGLSYWIWQERFNRMVPSERELIELRGQASRPDIRHRAHAVRFHFRADAPPAGSAAAPQELQARAPDYERIAADLAAPGGAAAVTAWVVRRELDRGPRDEPAAVLQLRIGERLALPMAAGMEDRAVQAASARLNAWIAAAGIGVLTIGLAVHWYSVLRP